MSENGLTSAYIKPLVQAWLASLDCMNKSSKNNRMYIEQLVENSNLIRIGIIQFYDRSIIKREQGRFYGDIMELMVYEMPADKEKYTSLSQRLAQNNMDPCFYLHFEMKDFEFVLEQLSSFFSYFYQTEEEKAQKAKDIPHHVKRVLICCTTGLTSSYFAQMMETRAKNKLIFSGSSSKDLPGIIQNWDLVLLTPQIYYLQKELTEQYGSKIQLMDRVDFATFNSESALKRLEVYM